MFNFIPLLIVLICLVVIAIIILRKFPQLTRVHTETIQEAKEEQTKKKIIEERLKRKTEKASKAVAGIFGSLKKKVSGGFEELQGRLEEQKKQLEKREPQVLVTKEDFEKHAEKIEQELEEAEELAEEEDFEKAERKYIDVISQDPKNIEAYEGLAELYFENKKYEEAKETFAFILRLDPEYALAYYDLAYIHFEQGELEQALKRARQALEIEPKNPKYVTLALEIALKGKDRVIAQMMLAQLKEANPENARLAEFEEAIADLS